MKLVKQLVASLIALSMGAVVAAENNSGSVSTDSSNPNIQGGSQDAPAYLIPHNDGGIELQHNRAPTGTSSDSDSLNTPADSNVSTDLNEATHGPRSSDQGANSTDTGSVGGRHNSGVERGN